MKQKPIVVAALVVVAVIVSEGFGAISQRVTRAGEGWLASAHTTVKHEMASHLAKAGAVIVVRWAKS